MPRLSRFPRLLALPVAMALAGCAAQAAERWERDGNDIVVRPSAEGAVPVRLQVVPRRLAHGFEVLPRRWVVERTFAWLGRYRRLSKDYEATCSSSEAFVKLAMAHLMARRLARRLQQ